MISAESTRSVRMAPEIITFSASGPCSTAGRWVVSWWASLSQIFSAPS